jgi:hypothetical protein
MTSDLESLSKEQLELVKLRDEILAARALKAAEAQKAQAETVKINADARGAQEALVKLWKKPTAWAAILPGLAALLTAGYGAYNGYFAAYFDTQKELLNAKVEMLKADTTKLEATKMVLEGELQLKRERLSDQQELVNRKREEFTKEKAIYDKEIADLQSRAAQLTKRSKQLPVEVPLNALLSSDDFKAEYGGNENYGSILIGLKNDTDQESKRENAALVSARAAAAKSPLVQALLYRTVYLAADDTAALQNMKNVITNRWHDIARPHDIFQYDVKWPKDVRRDLFVLMADVVTKANAQGKNRVTFSAVQALYNLCGWRCRDVDDHAIKLNAATQARNALLASNSTDYYEIQYSQLFLFEINPFAGRLFFAKLWKDDQLNRIDESQAKNFLESRPEIPDDEKSRPASSDKATWLKWLEQNQAKLEVVSQQPAETWPSF